MRGGTCEEEDIEDPSAQQERAGRPSGCSNGYDGADAGAHAPPGAGEAVARRCSSASGHPRSPSPQSQVPSGTHFTYFPNTKVQTLTLEELRAGGGCQTGAFSTLCLATEEETQAAPSNPGTLSAATAAAMTELPLGEDDGVYRAGVLLHVTKQDGRKQVKNKNTIFLPSYYYINILILLYMFPHNTIYLASSYYHMFPHTTVCVLTLLRTAS